MSNTQFAFLPKSSVPTRKKLQDSINRLGFDLELDPEFTPFEDEGFSPCILNKEENIGFEIFYEPTSEVIEDDEEFALIAGDNDYCISMCWRSSYKDFATVMIVSYALAKDFGAIISYEGEDPDKLEIILENTREAIHLGKTQNQREKEIQLKKEELNNIEDINSVIEEYLENLKGNTIKNISLFGSLMLSFKEGGFIRAKAYNCITLNGSQLVFTKSSIIRSLQIEFLNENNADELSKEDELKCRELMQQLEHAIEQEEKNETLITQELESWPEELIIESAIWNKKEIDKEKITISFSNVPGAIIEMFTFDSLLATIQIGKDDLQYIISPKGCKVS